MVSPRKSNSTLTFIPEEHCRMMPSSTKSCESLYSNASTCKGSATSANMLYRRKTPPVSGGGGGGGNGRQATLIPATTEVRQRVLSARRLRMKTYQNQLADAQQTIAELAHENRILRTLHKRQDSALAKYESTNAELPQLLHSHAEELRVWQTKYRNLQTQNKEIEQKLKQKEAIILSLSDQNKYFSQLNKDKNLEERQRLTEKLQNLETRLQEKDQDMKLMARKMQLETKNCKQQYLNEQKKTKEVLVKLEKARLELSGYRKLDEINLGEKFCSLNVRRRPGSGDNMKLEKDLKSELPGGLANDDDIDVPLSHRSTQSHNSNILGATAASTRTMRKSNVLTPLQRRVVDRGDGDANCLTLVNNISSTTITKSTLVTATTTTGKLRKQDSSSLQYEDDYENSGSLSDNGDGDVGGFVKNHIDDDADNDDDDDDDNDVDNEGSATAKHTGATANKHNDDSDDADEPDNDDDVGYDDDEEDGNDIALSASAKGQSAHLKKDITNIRKQITDDYREREAFLDTFCRQASSGALTRGDDISPHKVKPPAPPAPSTLKRNGINTNIPSNRKNKLLAALKAIDANKSFD